MHWSDEMLDGWVLAQALHETAEPEDAVVEQVATQIQERQRSSQSQDTKARRQDLRRVTQALKPRVAHENGDAWPPRMRALLATEVPREVGDVWLKGSPRPRRGFRASARLLQTLRILARARE